MSELNSLPIFFLGANNLSGYVSRFADCFDTEKGWQVWVIKGGPGSGKSTLMKKAAERLKQQGHTLYIAPCTADPKSLDAVVSDSRRLMLLDGTHPHPMDPPLPGVAGRIIDTGRFWNSSKLAANREKIAALGQENARLHSRAAGYMAAAAGILGESRRIALAATDTAKARSFGQGLAMRMLPKKGNGAAEQVRFLSGITPAGVAYYRSTAEKLCPDIVELWDEYGAAAGCVLAGIRQKALESGHEIINCRCPLHPLDTTDHLLLPQAGVGFLSVNRYLAHGQEHRRRIHYKRFTDMAALRRHKSHLNFNRRAAGELLGCAAGLLADAKSVHDMLEQYYIEAMDYPSLDTYFQEILEEI